MRGEDHGPSSSFAVAMNVTWPLGATSFLHAPFGVEPSVQLHGEKPPDVDAFRKWRAKYITQVPFGARATEGSCAKAPSNCA